MNTQINIIILNIQINLYISFSKIYLRLSNSFSIILTSIYSVKFEEIKWNIRYM